MDIGAAETPDDVGERLTCRPDLDCSTYLFVVRSRHLKDVM